MPFAVRSSGVVLSSFCLLLVAVITDHSLVLLVESAEIAGVTTYQVSKHGVAFAVCVVTNSKIAFVNIILFKEKYSSHCVRLCDS
jgi:amino acid permease